jgi:hypothetical protein
LRLGTKKAALEGRRKGKGRGSWRSGFVEFFGEERVEFGEHLGGVIAVG